MRNNLTTINYNKEYDDILNNIQIIRQSLILHSDKQALDLENYTFVADLTNINIKLKEIIEFLA